MKSVGVEEAVCDFIENDNEKSFLYKRGYKS